MKRQSIISLSAVAGCVLLSACGDDVTKVTNVTNEVSGMEIVASADSLGKCDSTNVGKTVYASDESAAYVCADSGWAQIASKASDGKDGTSCLVEMLADSSGYKVVCGGDSVGVVQNGKNGSDGKTGEKGDAGENGTACTVEALSDGSGYKIICGEDSVGVIANGVDGNGCTLKDNGDGTVTQVCGENTITLYKALCGETAYDPAKAYCIENTVYSCGEKPYDPASYKCHENELFAFFVDARDSQEYRMVTIGEQTWMAENLNFAYNEGTAQSYCYNNIADYCAKYGRLYLWSAAMDSVGKFAETGKNCGDGATCSASGKVRGVCPEDWHLPSYDEWTTLETYVANSLFNGKTDSVGYALKAKSGWSYESNGSDAFGFGALPAGNRDRGASFNASDLAFFWTATEVNADIVYTRELKYSLTTLYTDAKNGSKYFAFSVRCVKD